MKRRTFLKSILASTAAAGARPQFHDLHSQPLSLPFPLAPGNPRAPSAEGTDGREFFYRPAGAWAGDFIPYFHGGRFHLFFLLDWRGSAGHGEGISWYQISTTDFVHYEEHGEMLAHGTKNDQDLDVFTGSVTHGEGKYHIFYCGNNSNRTPAQAVMHAVSDDLLHWQKVPEDTFYAPPDLYEVNDWRDPYVFWNADAGEYWMLLAARLKNGPSRRRGCTGLCISRDLKRWEVRKPFWAPGLYYTHECPDLFQIGDWWYLVFSEFSDLVRTRYRMSRSLEGPWLTPEDDCFDGRAFYAAKTASDGQRRFLFGWNPTGTDKKDYRGWDWGGNLVVHELKQASDGALSVFTPPTVDAAWSKPLAPRFPLHLGQVKIDENHVEIVAPGTFACAAAEPMLDCCRIDAQMQFDPGTRSCGIMLRTSDDLEASYYLSLEAVNNRLVVESWPRVSPGQTLIEGPIAGLDRWIKLTPGAPVNLKVFVDRTIAVLYANDRIALSFRMYDLPTGRWGFFVNQGSAQFRNIRISTL